MSNTSKFALTVFVAGVAVAAAAGPASAQQTSIGGGATLNLDGKVSWQVAAAIGQGASAHNVVGGVTSGGGLSVGDKASINARGQADWQVAFAGGVATTATNNVGGVLGGAGALSAVTGR